MAQDNNAQSSSWLTDARKAYEGNDMHRAESLYRRVLAYNAKDVDSLRMLGLIIAQRGEFEEGLRYIDKAIAIRPALGRLYYFRGTVLEQLGRFEEAMKAFRKTISLEPGFVPVYINQGNVFAMYGRLQEAVASFNYALSLNSQLPEGYFNRGNAYNTLKQYEAAANDFNTAILLAPHFPPSYNNLGVALKGMGRHEEALLQYQRAIQLAPDFFHVYNNMGVALQKLGRPQEALEHFATALRGKPDYAEVFSNQGTALSQLGRYDEALASYERAISLMPGYGEVWNNKAYTLQELGRYEESLAAYNKAIALAPQFGDAYWNKSLLLLLLGDYEQGWPMYEWRWRQQDSGKPREFAAPLWLGNENVKGKTVLLHAEQGAGDNIQFCRYVERVQALGARVLLEVPTALAELMGSLKSKPTIITHGQQIPLYDYHCPLMSLPLAFKTRVETIPSHTPYLFADPTKRAAWREQLGPKDKTLRVGVAWAGNSLHRNDHNRSISLAQFATLFTSHPDMEFHALQKEISLEESAALRDANVTTHVTDLQNFADTAALIAELDLVISVDTSSAHLAGALGKPVWVLLPFSPDHRWFTERSDSPWYPTARLFRQTQSRQSPETLAKLSAALTSYPNG